MAKEPKFAKCRIRWKDTSEMEVVLFKLNVSYNEQEDDDVFFYVNSLADIDNLTNENNGEDFVVMSIVDTF